MSYRNAVRHARDVQHLQNQVDARPRAAQQVADARSPVVVGLNYAPAELPDTDYRIARYALGDDYHQVIREKLETLLGAIQAVAPDVRGRACVDSAPMLERDLAWLAGLGGYDDAMLRETARWALARLTDYPRCSSDS